MFRVMKTPVFRSTRLSVIACGIMHPQCCRPVAWKQRNSFPTLSGYRPATLWVNYTTSCNIQSSAPEDGWNHRPKHVELIGIINKPLLLHLVGIYIIFISYILKVTDSLTFQFFLDVDSCWLIHSYWYFKRLKHLHMYRVKAVQVECTAFFLMSFSWYFKETYCLHSQGSSESKRITVLGPLYVLDCSQYCLQNAVNYISKNTIYIQEDLFLTVVITSKLASSGLSS